MGQDQQQPESPLGAALRALSQDTGIYQDNLFDLLGPELPSLFGITTDDEDWAVRLKVVWQLDRLIERIRVENDEKTAEAQTIARVRFNLLGLPGLRDLSLERRIQRYQNEHLGPSESTSGRRMREVIVPTFEAQLSQEPLPHTPDAVLAAVRDARADVLAAELSERIVDGPAQSASVVTGRSKRQLPAWQVAVLGLVLLIIGLVVGGWFAQSASNGTVVTPPQTTSQQPTSPTTAGSTGTGNYQETAGSGGARTYTDPHTLSTTGQTLNPYEQVTVACKIYAPVMPSVAPGWWYRIVSPPWNDQDYAPANSFMNGDPPGVDKAHVDPKVLTCP